MSTQSSFERTTCRYVSSALRQTHALLKEGNEKHVPNKPLDMNAMNRQYEKATSELEGSPLCILTNFVRDVEKLKCKHSENNGTLLKKIALFALHCYLQIYLQEFKNDTFCKDFLAEIEQSDTLRDHWQSKMSGEMSELANRLRIPVREKIFQYNNSKSVLAKLLGSCTKVDKVKSRWEEIHSGSINFVQDLSSDDDEDGDVKQVDNGSGNESERLYCDALPSPAPSTPSPTFFVGSLPLLATSGNKKKRLRDEASMPPPPSSSSSSSSAAQAPTTKSINFTEEEWEEFMNHLRYSQQLYQKIYQQSEQKNK